MQIELIPRRRYGSGRVDTVFGPRPRRFPALGGPSWSRLCPAAVRVLSLPVAARRLQRSPSWSVRPYYPAGWLLECFDAHGCRLVCRVFSTGDDTTDHLHALSGAGDFMAVFGSGPVVSSPTAAAVRGHGDTRPASPAHAVESSGPVVSSPTAAAVRGHGDTRPASPAHAVRFHLTSAQAIKDETLKAAPRGRRLPVVYLPFQSRPFYPWVLLCCGERHPVLGGARLAFCEPEGASHTFRNVSF